jgi:hypothetical protein
LAVSVSKHLFVTNDGRLKHQQKPIETRLADVTTSSKQQVVHYVIRDHYSGVFYAEICSSKGLIDLADFLFRAWSLKEQYAFCGLPDFISIPQTVRDVFPSIDKLVKDYAIGSVQVTSGFQSGAIRDLKTWEDHVCSEIRCEEGLQLISAWTAAVTTAMSSDLNGEYPGTEKKIYKWHKGLTKEMRLPPKNGWYSSGMPRDDARQESPPTK